MNKIDWKIYEVDEITGQIYVLFVDSDTQTEIKREMFKWQESIKVLTKKINACAKGFLINSNKKMEKIPKEKIEKMNGIATERRLDTFIVRRVK